MNPHGASGLGGAKGVGEAPTIGVPPALVRALERQVGRRLTKTLLRPEDRLGIA